MGYISNIILAGLLLFSSCKNQAQNVNNPTAYIYGKWKVEKEYWRQLTKYGTTEVNSVKKSILHIEKDKIYFDNIKFIDTCKFSSSTIKFSKLLDKGNYEYDWFEDGTKLLRTKNMSPFPSLYTKEQLSKIDLIDLGCGYDLSFLYLKQDTLILDYCGGITFFLTKVPNEIKEYSGTGNMTKELTLTGKETELKLLYEFYKEPDELIIYDQIGKEIHHTGIQATTKTETAMINLNGVTKLVFKIRSKEANSKWKFSVEVR